jgi:tight adherence protein B
MLVPGIILCYLALLALLFGAFRPRLGRLPIERRRPDTVDPVTGLSRLTGRTSTSVEGFLGRRGWSQPLAVALEAAGLKKTPADFLILVASGGLIAMLLGYLLGGLGLGLLFCLLGPVGGKAYLSIRARKRRRAFADQLDDTLQLLAGGLRAGHSLLRAIDAVSREADSPTAEEFARVVNETRLGRDLNESLDQTASRMGSEDFGWVAQAIGIHREVGGDLAEVLDEVGHTIRERNQIRRQVASLSAEGKMSAYVLLALPFVVLGILMLTSPTYVAKFVQSPLGFVLMGVAVVMLTIGALWLKKVVSFKF